MSVLASYYAAMGATVLLAYFSTGTISPTIDWRVPFFLFVILVAVGKDYNIFLASRALEEQRRHGLVQGMRRAGQDWRCDYLVRPDHGRHLRHADADRPGYAIQIGFALAFGVLIDTFIVRPFLVPAFAILCWKAGALVRNWPAFPPPRRVRRARNSLRLRPRQRRRRRTLPAIPHGPPDFGERRGVAA